MIRKPCIIKSQFDPSKKVRVYWYEVASSEEDEYMDDDMETPRVNLYYTPHGAEVVGDISISMVEAISMNMIVFGDNHFPYMAMDSQNSKVYIPA